MRTSPRGTPCSSHAEQKATPSLRSSGCETSKSGTGQAATRAHCPPRCPVGSAVHGPTPTPVDAPGHFRPPLWGERAKEENFLHLFCCKGGHVAPPVGGEEWEGILVLNPSTFCGWKLVRLVTRALQLELWDRSSRLRRGLPAGAASSGTHVTRTLAYLAPCASDLPQEQGLPIRPQAFGVCGGRRVGALQGSAHHGPV